MTTKREKKPAKPRARKRIAWKGWAMFRDGNPTCVYFLRKYAEMDRDPDETIVPILVVREVPRRKNARGSR